VCRAWTSDTNEQSFATDLGAPGLCFGNAMDSVELGCDGSAGAGGDSGVDPGAAGASGSAN